VALAGAALAGFALSTGCTGGDAGSQPEAAATPLTAAELAVLDRAGERLIGGCMRRQGFTYWESAQPGRAAGEQSPPYVLDDVAAARAHGYQSAATPTDAELANDPNLRYVHGLPADRQKRYSTALNGSLAPDRRIQVRLAGGTVIGRGTDGCVAEADQTLYGDLAAWTSATVQVDNLAAELAPRVVADPRYLRAQAAWAGCMRAAGQPYPTPGDIRRKLGSLAPTAAAERAAATRLAVTEATCAGRTGFGRVAAAVDREYRAAVGPDDRTAVQTLRRLQRAALPRAQTVLAG
jgi:hypothetical protein